jgi:hypothetical protein
LFKELFSFIFSFKLKLELILIDLWKARFISSKKTSLVLFEQLPIWDIVF